MALLYPDQGGWTVDEYLALDAGRHVEYSHGRLEFLPMPDEEHQEIVFFLVKALKAYASKAGGKALMAPFPVQLWKEKFREPDVVYMRAQNLRRCKERYWEGADLAMEVVSESNREHDTNTKRAEYAKARIAEYWLLDPGEGTLTVLKLVGTKYVRHGEFVRGQVACSARLPGFKVDVKAALEAK
ncbi:MAG: Uma2 family endonuclease [Planctomycetes bacterium]|nr:Uma2 family endonuclease [Planctomycetota bacterium]